ncbi:PHP domain-containing protein [Candidatus Woesearchaeota archaeon]|nr:PHP domain-containing protein [Candidatus Woesearchaeota archaeon]
MLLKTELHTHINLDPQDKNRINYSAKELIDCAVERGFQVLGISCHNFQYFDKEMEKYARKRGLLLLSGQEKDVESKHTLLYNISAKIAAKINTLEDLRKVKKEQPEMLVIAAHPFHFFSTCHGKNVIKYSELFDAWEYSYFYTNLFNPNRKTERLAKKLNKPLVGNSDVHNLKYLGRTYSLIEVQANSIEEVKAEDVFQAIKNGTVKIVTKPVTFKEFFDEVMDIFKYLLKKIILKKD